MINFKKLKMKKNLDKKQNLNKVKTKFLKVYKVNLLKKLIYLIQKIDIIFLYRFIIRYNIYL